MRSGCRDAILLLLLGLVSRCLAYDHLVGGQNGWLPNPPEAFNHWANRNRFQVNDKLVFKYNKEEDSVLVVSKEHYDACNVTGPYLRLEGGNSVFDLARSGAFFFIGGNQSNCEKGEKLIVVVMAIRRKESPSPSPSSSSASAPAPRFPSSPSKGDGAPPTSSPASHHASSSSSFSYSSVLSVSGLGFGTVALFLCGGFLG